MKPRLLLTSLVSLLLGASVLPAHGAISVGPSATYIVTITPGARAAVEAATTKLGGAVDRNYNYVLSGFTVKLPTAFAAALQRIPDVLSIEQDQETTLSDIQNNQSPTPSWGLDRVDQRTPVGGTTSFGYRSAGAGATIYIVDTGILPHNDVAPRLSTSGFTAITDGNGTIDCNGHGTHVASTAAGTTYGVAKYATLVPVRVLGCSGSGSFSQVLAGLDWILSPENPNSKSAAVISMSLGGGLSTTVNNAIQKVTNAGITVVVAAGNDNGDACTKSPASAPSAITVGATTSVDAKASYSNYGSCVDINAPGSLITGAWIGSLSATNTISGTSMATPHVSGAAAVYLGLNKSASPSQVWQFLDQESTKSAISGLPTGTPNKLLFVSPTDGSPAIVPPVVAMKSVTNITHTSADILIDVNPGYAPTTLKFEYSKDAALSTAVQTATVLPGLVEGGAPTTASVNLTNLTASSRYYFRITGTNESGVKSSTIESFVTNAPPVTSPIPVALEPTDVTAYSARLNGTVNAGNAVTNVSFIYGKDPDFKVNTITTVASPMTVSGGTPASIYANVSFLDGGTKYYVKVVATNSAGTVSSPVLTFTPPVAPGLAPLVTTDPTPLSRTSTNATFVGTVHPQSQTTTVKFVYGLEKSLTTSPTTVTIPASPITGDTFTAVSSTISGLTPGKGYYYQFIALNASGLTKGSIQYAIITSEKSVVKSSNANKNLTNGITLTMLMNGMGSNSNPFFIYGLAPNLDTQTSMLAGTPSAVSGAVDTSITANVTGLTAGTGYYYRAALKIYSGPFAGEWSYGPIQSFETLNAVAPAPSVTPTPTPTPSVTPTPSPSPTVTPTPGVKSNQTITFPALATRFFNEAGTMLLATSTSKLPVTYSTETRRLCNIIDLGGGKVAVQPQYPLTGSDNVTCTITANQAGNTSFNPAPAVSQTLTFIKQSTKVVYRTSAANVTEAGTYLYANSQTTNGVVVGSTTMVTMTSLTPTVCTVSDLAQYDSSNPPRGTVRAKANGTCSIKIDFPGDGAQLPSTATWTSTISGISAPAVGSNTAQTITFPALEDRTYGRGYVLQATSSSKLPVKYTSLTPAACQIIEQLASGPAVQSTYPLTGAESMKCIIEASQAGDDRYAAATPVRQSFTYSKGAMKITVVAAPSKVTVNSTGTIRVSTLYVDNAMNSGLASLGHVLVATSLTPAVCAIASSGTIDMGSIYFQASVKGVSAGTCQVKFDFNGTNDRAATTTTASVTVTK